MRTLIEYVFAHRDNQSRKAFAYSVEKSKRLEQQGFDMIGTKAIRL